jgi:hypothetical protein
MHPWLEELLFLVFLGTTAMLDQLGRNVSFPAAMCSMQLTLEGPMNGTPSRPNHYPLNNKAHPLFVLFPSIVARSAVLW